MSFVRFRATYYSETAGDTWKIDILDTDADSGSMILFQTDTAPQVKYAGLPQDLKPGIYPTAFSVGMWVRATPKVHNGNTYGPHETFIDDLFTSDEGRFFLKLYKNDVHHFTGVVLPDQCSFSDDFSPYLLTIQAADGLYKLGTESYVSEVGQINYVTLRAESDLPTHPEFSSTPLEDGLEGSEWIMIEHYSEWFVHTNPAGVTSSRETTYARYEQYSVESPGTGWVDQGGSLWALALTYNNELEVEEETVYHLTRDIDNTPMRSLDEYIRRAMSVIPTKDEYGEGCMYDCCMQWYETGMYDLEVDPFTQIRWSENKTGVGHKWNSVIEDILKTFYCRLYYDNGRYHIEQISERSYETITRHCYDPYGVFIETETDVNLDISYADDDITVETGGQYKFLAPLRNVKITVPISGNNLLEDHFWDLGHQGSRYLGRIKKTETDTRLLIQVNHYYKVSFDLTTWQSLSDGVLTLSTKHRVVITHRVRITNIQTGTTYHLTPTSQDDHGESTWETDPVNGYFSRSFDVVRNPDIQGLIQGQYTFLTLSEDLPGDVDDSFDIYFSITYHTAFAVQELSFIWTTTPGLYERDYHTREKSLTTVDGEKEPVNSNAEIVYEAVNTVNNSLSYEFQAKFCDKGINDTSIEVKTSETPISWAKSRSWNRNGELTGAKELLQLEAEEILALRLKPRRIYSGGFITTLITTESRINRESIIYLPLSLQLNTDQDLASGEFLEIARSTPPESTIIPIPFVGEPIPGLTDAGNPADSNGDNPIIPMVFVTNEVIADEAVLTEVDIENTAGAFVQSGTLVQIIHPETGVSETVILTEDVDPDSTVMYFAEHTFTLGPFPDESLIVPQVDDGLMPTSLKQYYYFFKQDYTATEIHAPNFNFLNSEQYGGHDINKRYKVKRNGITIFYNGAASTPEQKIASYYYNHTTKKWLFWIGLSGETIEIEAW